MGVKNFIFGTEKGYSRGKHISIVITAPLYAVERDRIIIGIFHMAVEPLDLDESTKNLSSGVSTKSFHSARRRDILHIVVWLNSVHF